MRIQRSIFFFAVIWGVLCAAYWQGLFGGFFFDDLPNILAIDGLRLDALTPEALARVFFSGNAGPSGRPISQLSFALNYYFSGLDPFVFKATNLIIHGVNGLLVFVLARRLFSQAMPTLDQKHQLLASGFLAATWVLHPIQLLTVLHVVQRMASLSAFFLLLALLCHIHGRVRGLTNSYGWLLLGWCLFWPLSFLSKESGILFPLFALAWELVVRPCGTGNCDRFSLRFAQLGLLASGSCAVYLLSPFGNWLLEGYVFRSFSLFERLLTEGRALWFYLGLIIYPRFEVFALFHDDFPVSHGLFDPWETLPAILGLLVLIGLIWRVRERFPLVAFGLVWFLIGHAMESTVLPLELVHEHRNYLPLFGILLVFTAIFIRMMVRGGGIGTLAFLLGMAMLTYFPFVTALRAHEFGDEVRRTQIEAQHHRTSARAQHEAGRVLAGLVGAESSSAPAYYLAKTHYEMAGQYDPNFKMNWLGLIHLNCQAGLPVERLWIDELKRRLLKTPFAPGDRSVLYSLKEMVVVGTICLGRNDIDAIFEAAIANPTVSSGVAAMLHSWHADYLWLHEKNLAAAKEALGKSLKLMPGNFSNRLKWAQLVFIGGELEDARRLLLALRSEPLSVEEMDTLKQLLRETAIVDRGDDSAGR